MKALGTLVPWMEGATAPPCPWPGVLPCSFISKLALVRRMDGHGLVVSRRPTRESLCLLLENEENA
jgi:hypothetical protein